MKKVTIFKLKYCGYCRAALQYVDECVSKDPELKGLEIEQIDEREQYQLARQYDYFYVPTFYVDGEKVHEGVVTCDQVREILNKACQS